MMALGPMTRVQCEPESLSDQYLTRPGNVRWFKIEGGWLSLYLQDGASYMVVER